jgi:hypothetical protein
VLILYLADEMPVTILEIGVIIDKDCTPLEKKEVADGHKN